MAEEKKEQNQANVALGAFGTAGLITTAWALLQKKQGSAAPIDEATTKLLLAIAQSNESIDKTTKDLLQAIVNAIGADGTGSLQNPRSFIAWRFVPTAINTGEQMPSRMIPYGFHLVIKAYHTNFGIMYVAPSKPDAQNATSAYPLIANEAVELKIRDSEDAWIAATNLGDSVVCIIEQEV
ncbi:MAG: hypothetical protein GF350_05735 [Chitinivibrionales bacterium]|nr:hypothetical protein [Chitinivibrionales bacterium]